MDLNRAATFLRVVESKSFTAAATALGLPTSSVSRSVAKLERDLGVVLLERTTRRIALTDAGRAYSERLREALAGISEATALALDAAREPHGTVRLAVPPDVAPALAGVIARFLGQYPRIRVELSVSARAFAQVGEHADLGIAIGRLPDSSLISRRIGASTAQLFAAPSYLAARGRPRRLADLARHDAILVTGAPTTWELTGPRGVETVEVHGPVAGDHFAFLIEAARAGLGIALVPTFHVIHAVEAGALEAVLPRHAASSALQLLTPPGRHLPHRVALLRDFLATQLGLKCTEHS